MRTVQGELNKSLKKFLSLDKVKTVGAGNPNNVASAQGNSGAGIDDLSNSDNTLRDIQDNPR
jgi:hypothetical protein